MKLLYVCSHPVRFSSHKHCGSGDNFLIYNMTSRDHVFNGLNFLILCHHFAIFCGHRPCGSSDIVSKVVYMTLQGHVVKGSGNLMKRNSSLYIPTLASLMAIDIVL